MSFRKLRTMMLKKPRSPVARMMVFGVKAGIAAELVGLGVTYYYWRKLNTSQDYRYTMYQKYPSILNSYYKIGESFGKKDTRTTDYEAWGVVTENK